MEIPYERLYIGDITIINNEYVIVERNKYPNIKNFNYLVVDIKGENYLIVNSKQIGSKIKLFIKKIY